MLRNCRKSMILIEKKMYSKRVSLLLRLADALKTRINVTRAFFIYLNRYYGNV